jgi:nucleoside-diphosphate-sugar epimerase
VGDWGSWAAFRAQVVGATANLVKACCTGGVGRVLHVSSISVYGHPRKKERITEDEPFGQCLRWLDHYCRAKILAEQAVAELGPAVTIVRPSWIYGPRDRNGLPRLARALHGRWARIQGTGDNPLNIVHAADVAEGAILAANHSAAVGQAYHLCGAGDLTQREFLGVMCSALDLPQVDRHVSHAYAWFGGLLGDIIPRVFRWNRPPYISRYSVGLMSRPNNYSNDKAQRQLGWRPRVPSREGIRQAVAWLSEQNLSPVDVHF